ncbi:methylamine utilization protein [Pseudoalteromonas sp. CO302Y]|uniref:methylamine utilization protein n=1 Tax=unclassified Pseudoalteromonas TaxID=194690 RepID=UPI001023BAD3|nr:methylamine utilization protein [Pseudoalteromonas sp. CO302Y]RZG11235.1 methylamine utilization protein [Pseudoalteromonas sp. CO133X]
MFLFAHCLRATCGLALFTSSTLFAADISFVVRDQLGNPLSDAVIEQVAIKNNESTPLPVAVMDQVNKQFSPTVLIVQQGQLVDFPNSDDIRHHVYSFSPAKVFDIKLYAGQPEKPEKFDTSGVVVLGCNIHDSMVGYIYVAKNHRAIKTNQQGMATLKDVIYPLSLTIWHPNQVSDITFKQSLIVNQSPKKFYEVIVETVEPAPRNTFGEMFKVNNG